MTWLKRIARGGVNEAKRWATTPIPLGRVAAFRTLIYLYIPFDLLVITPWIYIKGNTSGGLYRPLHIANFLHLPTPNPVLVGVLYWSLLILPILAATNRFPRLLGFPIFLLYTEWLIIGMSYGKVDHDRISFLVALAVLPFLGRARQGDPTRSENAGYGFRVVQLGVIATYFLSFWSKVHRSGLFTWANGAIYAKAILRRGTIFSWWTLKIPHLLVLAQWGTVAFEVLSPVIFFVKQRLRYFIVAFFYLFHTIGYMGITIGFWPHLVALTCFLPLEKPVQWVQRKIGRGPAVQTQTSDPEPSEVTTDTSGAVTA